MNNPRTIYEILLLLEKYHDQRCSTYNQLGKQSSDSMAQILLEHLVELEDHSLKVVREEMKQLDPAHATYLTSGPVISHQAAHAKECRCDSNPSFQETLACALESDQLLNELICRLQGCSAAPSVLGLAKRLRELEEIKGRQIANFTRPD